MQPSKIRKPPRTKRLPQKQQRHRQKPMPLQRSLLHRQHRKQRRTHRLLLRNPHRKLLIRLLPLKLHRKPLRMHSQRVKPMPLKR